MTRHVFYDPATGRIAQTTIGGHPASVAMSTGLEYIDTEDRPSALSWVQDGVLQHAPEQPAGHDWDWDTKTWKPDVEASRARKREAINAARDTWMAAPILYAGAWLDADAAAQRNIAAKLQELAQRAALQQPSPPELLVWRDAENRLRTFSSEEHLASWLGNLSIAISERATRLYAWSWIQKGQVDAATDVAVIESVSVDPSA